MPKDTNEIDETAHAALLDKCRLAIQDWQTNHEEFADATLDLALALRALRDIHRDNKKFSAALKEAGWDKSALNDHDRRVLLEMGKADHVEVAREILAKTDRRSPQHIWLQEIEPELIARGIIKPKPEPKATDAGDGAGLAHVSKTPDEAATVGSIGKAIALLAGQLDMDPVSLVCAVTPEEFVAVIHANPAIDEDGSRDYSAEEDRTAGAVRADRSGANDDR